VRRSGIKKEERVNRKKLKGERLKEKGERQHKGDRRAQPTRPNLEP